MGQHLAARVRLCRRDLRALASEGRDETLKVRQEVTSISVGGMNDLTGCDEASWCFQDSASVSARSDFGDGSGSLNVEAYRRGSGLSLITNTGLTFLEADLQ